MRYTVIIYALCDPETLAVRYVGKTINLPSRINSHRWEARNPAFQTHKARWLRSLGGREPVVKVLAEVPSDQWQEAERFWIGHMRNLGCDLTNFADGGQTSPVEGKRHRPDSIEKMREAAIRNGSRPPSRKGSKSSPATIAKLRLSAMKRGARPHAMGGWNKGIVKTHCKNGHEYTPANTRIVVRKDRNNIVAQQCRICERAAQTRFQTRRLTAAGG
jgi:hypothetical protein